MVAENPVAGTVSSKWAKGSGGPAGDELQNLIAFGKPIPLTDHQNDRCVAPGDVHPSLPAQGGNHGGGAGSLMLDDRAWQVRRLMPVECERLQGFPDGWTQIPWRGKAAEECPDGHRYKALGNSMAVNVMRWIGMRIQMVEDMGLPSVEAAP